MPVKSFVCRVLRSSRFALAVFHITAAVFAQASFADDLKAAEDGRAVLESVLAAQAQSIAQIKSYSFEAIEATDFRVSTPDGVQNITMVTRHEQKGQGNKYWVLRNKTTTREKPNKNARGKTYEILVKADDYAFIAKGADGVGSYELYEIADESSLPRKVSQRIDSRHCKDWLNFAYGDGEMQLTEFAEEIVKRGLEVVVLPSNKPDIVVLSLRLARGKELPAVQFEVDMTKGYVVSESKYLDESGDVKRRSRVKTSKHGDVWFPISCEYIVYTPDSTNESNVERVLKLDLEQVQINPQLEPDQFEWRNAPVPDYERNVLRVRSDGTSEFIAFEK